MSVGTRVIRNVESAEWNWFRRYAMERETPMGTLLTQWLGEKRDQTDESRENLTTTAAQTETGS